MSYQARNAYRDARKGNFDYDSVTRERADCFQHGYWRGAQHERFTTIGALEAFCEVNSIRLEFASEYGEPGYTHPEKGILFSNWNKIPKSLQKRLEAQGYALEWEDEWYADGGRSPVKAYRTQADSHGWESRVRYCDGDVLTPDSDAQEWIDSSMNEEGKPLPSWFDESELDLRGFKEIDQDDKQVGFHPGQNETPDKFMPALIAEGYEVILQITDRGQFDTRYKVWTRREAKRELFLDEARGVYIPKAFADNVKRDRVTGVSDADYEILESGPDHEWYWDTWAGVCNDATLTGTDGIVYTLDQDGSLFLVEKAGEFCEHEDKYYVNK